MAWELAVRGADLDAADADYGFTAFHMACEANQPACVAVVGCNTELKTMDGRTGKQVAEADELTVVLEWLKEGMELRQAKWAAALRLWRSRGELADGVIVGRELVAAGASSARRLPA